MNSCNYSVSGVSGGSCSRVTSPNEALSVELASAMDEIHIVGSKRIDPAETAMPNSTEVDILYYISADGTRLDRELSCGTDETESNLNSNEHKDLKDDEIVDEWERSGSRNLLMADVGKKSVDLVDGAIVPIKHEIMNGDATKNMFVEGKKLLTGASKLQFHDANTLFIAYLDSCDEGILHLIPGWTQREILEDIVYRFKAGRTMETEIPFLGGVKCKKRTYQCQGVLVCPKSTDEFRCLHHCTVEGDNPQVLKTVELFDDSEIVKRNALNIYHEVRSKQQYCSACVWESNGIPKRCNGAPVVRERKGDILYGSKFFLGCTGFHRAPNLNHAIHKLDSLDVEGLSFLRELLSGRLSPPRLEFDQECFYIHSKKKRCNAVCQVHRDVLIHVPCEDHKMNIFEPIPQPGVEVPKMVHASCFGKHTHPPPPPPDHTLR